MAWSLGKSALETQLFEAATLGANGFSPGSVMILHQHPITSDRRRRCVRINQGIYSSPKCLSLTQTGSSDANPETIRNRCQTFIRPVSTTIGKQVVSTTSKASTLVIHHHRFTKTAGGHLWCATRPWAFQCSRRCTT